MKRFILTATLGSVGLALAACGGTEEATTVETPEPADADAGNYEAEGETMAAPANIEGANGEGTRLRVGPDGARLDVGGEDADVSVDTEGAEFEVDTGE
ncbi:MAG: hypothetical protein LC634_09155 [Sphingomonadales bacterium]|nr:hypothetical protein [Sphingomonadales bacterium]